MTPRFARPAATSNRPLRYFLCVAVSWLLVGVFVAPDTATGGVVRGQSPQAEVRAAHRSLQLTATVIGQEYCSDTAMRRSQMELKLKLTVKNISGATLLVCRYCNSIRRVVLSKSLKKAESGDYAYNQYSTVGHLPFPEMNDSQLLSPEAGLFVTLKPGESFDYEYPQSVGITLTDAGDRSVDVSPGQYLLQVKIETWDWDLERAKMLHQRLAQSGSLFYRDIASKPLAVSILRLKALDPCK